MRGLLPAPQLCQEFEGLQLMCRVVTGTGREKLKQDGVNIADWLTALALFTGHAAKVRLCFQRVRTDEGIVTALPVTYMCGAAVHPPTCFCTPPSPADIACFCGSRLVLLVSARLHQVPVGRVLPCGSCSHPLLLHLGTPPGVHTVSNQHMWYCAGVGGGGCGGAGAVPDAHAALGAGLRPAAAQGAGVRHDGALPSTRGLQ